MTSHDHLGLSSDEQDGDGSSAMTPLRSASPLVIEEDEDLASFLQRETHDGDPLTRSLSMSSVDPILRSSGQDHFDAGNPLSPTAVKEATQPAKLTQFTALLTITACFSGLLFGYDTGVISSTLVSMGTDLDGAELSTLAQSLITSSTSLFALLASPPGGWAADVFGRRWVVLVADLLFIAGAVVQYFSGSVWMMVVGRSIVGAGVGAASLVTPLFVSELAPPEFRGRLVVVNSLFVTGGQMIAYATGWLFADHSHGWRWMVGLGAVPALLQLVLLTTLPESPRWLIKVGRIEPARNILNKAYGAGTERTVDALVRTIEREVLEEEEIMQQRQHLTSRKAHSGLLSWRPAGWRELFGIGGHRRALAIACLLQGLQQLCGFNVLMYFSASIFRRVGFQSPILASLSVAVTNFIFTLVAMLLIDRIGRRRILLLTIPGMVVTLALTALGFSYMGGRASISAVLQTTDGSSTNWPMMILASIVAYVACYATGLGSVPWQQSELFPLIVRSLGCGIATATNWGSNFVVGLTFLPIMQLLTPSFTFLLYAAICAVGWLLVYLIYPETRGLGLEEVGGLLRHGWGVEASLKRTRRL